MDDLGWTDVGCYGSMFYRTPNIDRLAAQGVRFSSAYAAAPVCSPTRASLLTGKHPARLHLTDWLPGRADMPTQKLLRPAMAQRLALEEETLAEALTAAGYICASIGKWHLGGQGFGPEAQGFALNIAGDHTGTPLSYFAPFQREGRAMPGLERAEPGEYLTERLTAEAEKFIEANQERPFFLYLAHYAVHIPLKAKADLVANYTDTRPSGPQTNAIYAAMIESMDQSVGRIVEQLRLTDRTVVVFTSDNGGLSVPEGPHTPATSNAPLRAGKGYLYEGGLRVPLIVRGPGRVRAGVVDETPVSSVDLYPTLLRLAGVSTVAKRDGADLSPLLVGAGRMEERPLYWHYPHYSNQGGKPGGAIRDGAWKLIEFYEDSRLELYNLSDDLAETNNLAPVHAHTAQALRAQMRSWRRSVQAQMMEPNPEYEPARSELGAKVVPQMPDGRVFLHGRDARIHGSTVRYEPEPHKRTIGYWTKAEDWVSWEFEVTEPGLFGMEILQGCGTGSGGSEVEFKLGDEQLSVVVQETGGFQNFVRRAIGQVRLERAGRHRLEVRPKTKPGLAVMDLRSVTLQPERKEAQ